MYEKYSFALDVTCALQTSSFVQRLIRYSAGLTPRSQVMQHLGINHHGVLLQRLNSVGLFQPTFPMDVRQKMADDQVQELAHRDLDAGREI